MLPLPCLVTHCTALQCMVLYQPVLVHHVRMHAFFPFFFLLRFFLLLLFFFLLFMKCLGFFLCAYYSDRERERERESQSWLGQVKCIQIGNKLVVESETKMGCCLSSISNCSWCLKKGTKKKKCSHACLYTTTNTWTILLFESDERLSGLLVGCLSLLTGGGCREFFLL